MQDLTKISFEGGLMIRFTDNVVNLWYEGLPEDVHFSLSINKSSTDINFHVTREVDNPGNKPKNRVFVIARNICDDLVNDIGRHLLHETLSEINIAELKGTVSPRFISHSSIEKSNFYLSVEKEIMQLVPNFIKYRGKKELRIKNNVADELEKFTPNELAFIELYNTSLELIDIHIPGIQSGIIVTEESIYSVIHSNGKWYVQNNNITIDNLLISFFGEKLARQMFYRTKKAIVIVRNANSYAEVKQLDNPFRISKKRTV